MTTLCTQNPALCTPVRWTPEEAARYDALWQKVRIAWKIKDWETARDYWQQVEDLKNLHGGTTPRSQGL